MKWCLLMCFGVLSLVGAEFRIEGAVRRRTAPAARRRSPRAHCLSDASTSDYDILASAVSESRYIFTARVLSVRRVRRGAKPNRKVFMVYRLYVWLVMKGDMDELRSHVFSGDQRTLNGATVTVDWLRTNKCAYKLYRHSSGIFLSDGFHRAGGGRRAQLRLLDEPLPLTLYDLDRVNAALNGEY